MARKKSRPLFETRRISAPDAVPGHTHGQLENTTCSPYFNVAGFAGVVHLLFTYRTRNGGYLPRVAYRASLAAVAMIARLGSIRFPLTMEFVGPKVPSANVDSNCIRRGQSTARPSTDYVSHIPKYMVYFCTRQPVCSVPVEARARGRVQSKPVGIGAAL